MMKSTSLRLSIETAAAQGQSMTVRATQPFPHFGIKECQVVGVDKRKVQLREPITGRQWSAPWSTIQGIVLA